MGTSEVFLTPRDCAFVKDVSFARAFGLAWSDLVEESPYMVALVHPEVPPLSLKVSSLHLVGLTRRQQAAKERIFLIDIIFRGLPRRAAVRAFVGDTVRDVVLRLGLLHLCGPEQYRCLLTQYEGERVWNLFDVIEEPHATSFKLLFRSYGKADSCATPTYTDDTGDMVSMMQMATSHSTVLIQYVRGWTFAKGSVTFWIHCSVNSMLQRFSAICGFDRPMQIEDQCASFWQHCGPRQHLTMIPVDPPPVFLVLPRPHVLVIGDVVEDPLPVLCQVHERGRHDLVSVLLSTTSLSVNVAHLFDLVLSHHECEFGSYCHLVYMDDRFLYGEEVQLHRGAFVKIYETARDDYDRETTCDGAFEDDAESAALSWTDEYVDLPEVDSLLDSATPSGIQSEADSVTLMQGQRPESVDGSDPPTTLSTRRTDSEGLCAGYSVRGPIEQAPHYQSQAQQVEDLRIWLADLLGTDPPVTLFVFEGLGADVTTHQIVFTHTTLSDAARFPIWLQRELRTLWRGQARIFPLQSAPYHDLRIAVLLQAAYGHELPVLLEIHQLQDTWREIHVVTQAVTINSLVWRSRLPQIVPETQQYQVALSGELAGPGDLIPWAPGQWLSIVVGPLGHYHGEDTTASSLNPSLPSLSTLAASQAASSSLDTPVAGLTGDPLEGPILAPLLPEIGESDYPRVAEDDLSFLFQIQVSGRAHEWLRGPRPWLERDEPLQRERRRFLEWRRKVDITRRTTRFYSFDYFAHEATAFLAAREQWPDFVIYSTKDEQITHWGLAVDQYFVLERFDFATVVRDYLRSVIPFHTKVALIPVKPWPGLHEQQGEDDLFLLVDEDPVCDAIPVMVSLWVREGDRAPELSARRLPLRTTTLALLQMYGVEEVCSHQMYHCVVRHFSHELPRWMHWKPFPGMKIDITIDFLQTQQCDMRAGEFVEESILEMDDPSMMQLAGCSTRRVPRATDLDPMMPLRSVHTWHGNFLLPNPVRDQVRIGIRMTMPGSLDMIAAFHFVCWGVLSTTSLSGIFREVVLDQGRWDEQFQIAVSDMGIPQPTRLVLVAAQPPESNFKHMMAMSDDLFHSGFRFFLLNWPVKQTSSYVVVPCPEYCSFDYLTTFLGLGELCKDDICVLRCLVPRGPSTYTSGESITMPTGTYCRFEFYAPEEVACVPYVLPQGELQLLQRSVRRFRIDHGSSAFCREPTCGLPPPGNPVDTGELQVHWLGHDFQKLDDWRVVDSGIQVFDYPSCSLHLSDFVLPCQPRGGQILTLADKVIGREIQMPDFSPLHHSLSQQWVDAEIQWTPFIEQLSPDLQAEAAELLLDLPPHVDYLEIFTDGSFSTGTEDRLAGWSLLIFGHRGPERYIIGYDWGLVSVDPMDPTWTGAESSNAKSAEVAALIRAIEWLFAHPQRCTCKLRFDSQLAGYSGNGDYNINPSDRQLRLLRALVQAYQTSAANSSRLSWEHVKGHSGNLGNEMADIFAKNAFLGQQELRDQPRPDYAPFVFGYRFPIESFWLYYCNLAPGTPLLQNAMLHLPGVHIGGDAIDRLPENLVTPPDHKMKQKQLSVFAATYNVMTLGPRGGSLFVQYLREQAVAHGLDILFLQETRSRHDQLVISATHYRYTAAAKDGVGGVEIWLTRERRKTGHAAFDKATTQVLHAAAQCLLLKTTLQGVTLLLLTFHAPHSGRGRHDIELFWQSLTSLVRPYVQKFPNLIVGADANAHFATELDGHIGYAGLEHATDHGGDCFRRFLLDFDLFIPSTFEHIHRGSHQTWWSFSAHKGARCDYFAVPKSWSTSFFQTEVKTSLDEGKAGIDHLPLTMHCKILFCTSVRVRSKEGFDRRSLQEATKEQIQGVLRDVQIPAWHEGIDQHAMKLVRQIHDRLCQEFPPKKGPRKSYISEAAWQIRSMRLRLRREAIKQKHMVDCLSLSWALDCWKGTRVLDLRELFLQGLRLYKSIQQTRQQSAETTKTLKRKLRADRTESLEQLAKAEPQMSQREFAQALQALGVRNAKKPSCIQPLPFIQNAAGQPVDTYEELLVCWREYFGEQEDGIDTSAEALLSQSDCRWAQETVVPPWDFLPTLNQIEHQFRRAKPGKSFFLDGIPGELLHKAPAVLAHTFYSLFCKQIAFMREPVIFKGGFLTPVFKKGSPKLIQNYRSLFVSSVLGKALHSIYRKDLVHSFESQRMQLQVGGIPGQGTTQPAHALRLHQLHAIREGRSSAIVFVDISNAFYRLLRQHIVQVQGEHRSLQQLFEKLGLPQGSYEEFCALLERPAAIEEAGVSPHLQAIFGEFFESTWFKLRDDAQLVQTRRGSRPGDSFADLCFSFALVKIIRPAIELISNEFPDVRVAWNGAATPFPGGELSVLLDPVMPIWADDLALAFDSQSPTELLDKCESIVACLFDSLQNAGLRPNLKPGKSEILMDLRGKGALQCRRQLAFQDHKLTIPSTVDPFSISVVGAYRHLGTWIQVGGGIARELKVKFATAHDAMTKYRSQIFANRAMTLVRKRQFFDSLVLSVISYNAAVWVPRNKKQGGQLDSAFHRLYQRFAVLHFGVPAMTWSRKWLLYKLGLPEAAIVMLVARLRYLGQLIVAGQPILWALLQRDRTWHAQLVEDMRCLWRYCPEVGEFFPLQQNWLQLFDYVTASPMRWKRTIRKLQARAIAVQKLDVEWMLWHQDIRDRLLEHQIVSPCPKIQYNTIFCCLCCKKTFATKANMAVHAFKKHGRVNKARAYVTGQQCERCLKHYELHSDLINHVKRGGPCFDFYQNRGLIVRCEPAVNSRAKTRRKSLLRHPHMQAAGPRCQEPQGHVPAMTTEVLRLQAEWTAALRSEEVTTPLLERLRLVTTTTFLYLEEIHDAFDVWVAQQGESTTLSTLAIFGQFRRMAEAEWLLSGVDTAVAADETIHEFFQREAGLMHELHVPIPRAVRYSPKVFAHLFSGARRKGDFQQHVEALHAMAISVDIIFDLTWGNLLQPTTFDLFSRAMHERVLTGFLSGPPCETWSRARAANMEGPRVLRSRDRLQGCTFLTRRETEQVSIGNQLLGVTLRFFLIALITGALAILEHPACPDDDMSLPSIWYLEVIGCLLRFPGCEA